MREIEEKQGEIIRERRAMLVSENEKLPGKGESKKKEKEKRYRLVLE